jgi:CRP/FNR family transcriptional regulator, cyclic AMP receptor protein
MRRVGCSKLRILHKALDLIMARQNETLARIPLFRSLSVDAIEKLNTRCSWRRVSSGQWLIDYQDASSNVFLW